jgi:hypothetical protein
LPTATALTLEPAWTCCGCVDESTPSKVPVNSRAAPTIASPCGTRCLKRIFGLIMVLNLCNFE